MTMAWNLKRMFALDTPCEEVHADSGRSLTKPGAHMAQYTWSTGCPAREPAIMSDRGVMLLGAVLLALFWIISLVVLLAVRG